MVWSLSQNGPIILAGSYHFLSSSEILAFVFLQFLFHFCQHTSTVQLTNDIASPGMNHRFYTVVQNGQVEEVSRLRFSSFGKESSL